MQRILSVYDWAKVEPGEQITIESDRPDQRLVRIRVNAPSPVAIYLKQPDFEGDIFLALVQGLDTIEFNVAGSYTLLPTGGELWFDTLDGHPAHVEAVDERSFATLITRKARNLEREIIEHKANQNFERLLKAQEAQFLAKLAAMEARHVNTGEVTPPASNGTSPAQSSGAQTPPLDDDAGNRAGGGANGA